MRVLFCNIAWMEHYNGITENDEPRNGGTWVQEHNEGAECLNFALYDDGYCHGFVATKSNKGNANELHIERIEGVSKESDEAEHVLVIWAAKDPYKGKNYIVGWYKDATVTRNYYGDGDGWPKNIYARHENCVLLPNNKRHKIVPRAGREGYSYGMGQANVWFGKKGDKNAELYIKNMITYIETYSGENLAEENWKGLID